MTTLSSVTAATRKILEIIGICVGALILLFVVFSIGSAIKEMIAPTPPPPPTVSFGKLPAISFPISSFPNTFSYSVNTLTGSLPVLPPTITVYKLQHAQSSLVALDKAKQMADAAGFKDDPTSLSDTVYKWNKSDPFPQTLTLDTESFDFLLTSSYITDPTVVSAVNLPTEEGAIKAATNFFQEVSPLPDSIDSSKTKTTLFSITNGILTPATSLSNTQVIRVDFFLKNINSLPLYTPTPDASLIYALVTSSDNSDPQIVEAQFSHKDSSTTSATYPLKTTQEAFDELKNGKAYIAAAPQGQSQITITDVTLGYYIDTTSQDYLEPIIVFQGDKGFYAYVPAVTDSWVK